MSTRVSQILAGIGELPVPVKSYPYWTVLYRPESFAPERIESLTECYRLVEKTRVQLRGWDFPHLAQQDNDRNGRVFGSNWIGCSANFMGSIEYWQLFQSGQFFHFAAVREATESQWRAKLQQQTASHLRHHRDINWETIPGYISLVNMVYLITEYFEFAARICQTGVYVGNVEISIGLHNAAGFLLTTEWDRAWSQYCPASSDELIRSWQLSSESLLAGSSDCSLKAISWMCECFGWMSPNLDALRSDQQKLLTGRF